LKEEIRQLTDLQVIDLQIAGVDEEINAGQAEIKKLLSTIEERQSSIEELKAKIDAAAARQRELEAQQEDELSRIKERQSKMMQVQTNREYHSLLKEIEDGKKANKEREEETVQLMEKIESLTLIMKEQQGLSEGDDQQLTTETKKINGEAVRLNEKKQAYAKEREAMVKNFSPSLLKKYDMLRARRNGRAVVSVVNGVCQGCFMNIPPQQFNDLLKGEKMLFCPTCNRILYYQAEAAAE
jgi:predicted  nucleic acid-binding Zn-ribbon protein